MFKSLSLHYTALGDASPSSVGVDLNPKWRWKRRRTGQDPASHPQIPMMESILTQFGVLLTHPHLSTNTCAAHSHTCTGSAVWGGERGGVVTREALCG